VNFIIAKGYSTVSDTLFLTTEIYKKSLKIPKGVIRIRKSKKDRQHNGQKKKAKRTNNDLISTYSPASPQTKMQSKKFINHKKKKMLYVLVIITMKHKLIITDHSNSLKYMY
jgi:hypothetical protein